MRKSKYQTSMRNILLLLLSSVLLVGCSAQWHLRKAYKKDPTLQDTIQTIVQYDTIVYWNTDTIHKVFTLTERFTDTMFLDTGGIKVKIVKLGKEIKVSASASGQKQVTGSVPVRVVRAKCPECPQVKQKRIGALVRLRNFVQGLIIGIFIGLIIRRLMS